MLLMRISFYKYLLQFQASSNLCAARKRLLYNVNRTLIANRKQTLVRQHVIFICDRIAFIAHNLGVKKSEFTLSFQEVVRTGTHETAENQ